jgi:hypothetical protein
MCAEAIFSDQSGDPAGQFMRAAEFGQNFMQRRQRQQWEQEDRAENQRVRTLFEPVMQAQRQAQVASALSSLETTKQQEQLRTRFAAEAPVYNKLFQDAMKLPTFGEQQAALAQLQPQVTWMGLIPEGKGFVDAVNNSRALAFQSDLTDKRIQGTLIEAELRKAAELQAIRTRAEEARNTIRVQGEETRSTNASRPNNTTFMRDAQRIQYLRQQAAQLREIDPETADLMDRRAEYLSNPSGGGSGDDVLGIFAPGLNDPAPTPVPTPVVTPTPAPTASGAKPSTNLFEGITY